MRSSIRFAVLGAGLLAISLQLSTTKAGIVDPAVYMPGISGTSQTGIWNDLSAVTVEAQTGLDYPGHPGSGAWPGNVPNQSGTANLYLTKVANGPASAPPAPPLQKAPYFASQGPFDGTTSLGRMHYAGFTSDPNTNAGTLGVGSTSTLAGMQNLVFQVEISEVFGHTFFNNALPTLNFNGGSQDLIATHSRLVSTTEGPDATPIHTWLVQWDTSTIGPISDFEIQFTGVEHSDVYALRVDQYDTFVAAPEPSTLVLSAMGMLGMAVVAIRRRRAANV